MTNFQTWERNNLVRFAKECYEKLMNDSLEVKVAERKRIAEVLRQRAQAHPKWEVHDILMELAKEIEDHA